MYPVDPREEKWLLTSKGHIFVSDYMVYDQNKYCMDVFYNISEFDDFYLFVCFENPSTKYENLIRYIIFLNCKMYYSTTITFMYLY